ncbi:MAG: hypothetical protein FJ288_03725 [Planctomycetes bacterium]|nr:hypothetical protein [Planctomycetota bacterium]
MASRTSIAWKASEGRPLVNAAGLWTPGTAAYGAPGDEEVSLARAWIRQWADVRRTINPLAHSYALKRAAEQWAGCAIGNGAFIQAARDLGFRFRRVTRRSPNAVFNIGFSRWRRFRRLVERNQWL